MGYEGVIGCSGASPIYQASNKIFLWDIREYGLSELWVKRELTIALCSLICSFHPILSSFSYLPLLYPSHQHLSLNGQTLPLIASKPFSQTYTDHYLVNQAQHCPIQVTA